MKKRVLEIIQEISIQKLHDNINPVHVSDKELTQAIKKEVLLIIKQLYKEKAVDIGRSINNNFIKLRTDGDEKLNNKPILHKIND